MRDLVGLMCAISVVLVGHASRASGQSAGFPDSAQARGIDAGVAAPAHEERTVDAGAPRTVAISSEVPPDAGGAISLAPPLDGGAPPPGAIDVVVRSGRSEAKQLQESADAVTVVDLAAARRRTADLGEVLARTQGVSVRRSGGLGSTAEVSMAGLEGEQIRILLDGVPVERAGYPFGVANLPVNLLERVEVYRGVVPVRFGADALGGAVNLVTDASYESHAAASYQVGSFGLHRAAVNGRYRHDRTGIIAGVNGFLDIARNDYRVRGIAIGNADGSSTVRALRRFHDGYRAYGANVELGVVDRPWARRLTVNGFGSRFTKELQHNALMTLVYGEVESGETSYGATARWDVDVTRALELNALANYVNREIVFQDLSPTGYLWTGERGVPIGRGASSGGEINQRRVDQAAFEHGVYTRVQLAWTPAAGHRFRVATTPQFTTRRSENHIATAPRAEREGLHNRQLTLVSGLEHELALFADRLSNTAFVKSYFYTTDHETLPTGAAKVVSGSRSDFRFGAGDGLRFRFTPWLLAKASYEYATRLPLPDELFGNGALVSANAELDPEVSHNVNVGPRADVRLGGFGKLLADVNLFMRDTRDMIVLLGGSQFIPYRNIGNARGFGVEAALGWTSPGQWLRLDGTYTMQDIRNTSETGPYAQMNGQRIPNRPWMFASWGASVRIPHLPGISDVLEPHYTGRFTRSYNRGWDIGNPEYWIRLPSMYSHDIGVSYLFAHDFTRFAATFDVLNVADKLLFDTFGVQRPGRAYYLKLSGEI